MKRRDFLAAGASAVALALPLNSIFAQGGEKKKLLYYERSTGFIHPSTVIDPATGLSVTGRVLKKLGAALGYEVVCTKNGRIFDGDLDQFDAFLLYCCGTLTGERGEKDSFPMSKEGEKRFFSAIRDGKGVLGFHSATDTCKSGGPSAFENCPEDKRNDYTKMIGGEFIVHGSQQETTIRVVKSGELPSFKPFGDALRVREEWYCLKNFNPDMHVIMVQETEGMREACNDRPPFPCTWARMEGKGRVAYTSLAHNNSTWETDWLQAIVFDLMRFVTKDLEIDLTPNINEVTPGAYTLKR
ncbi:MAG: ThuA domain-containing protein [Planctomycetia bacterium]|nr:ThuA domain-containing protein [Planctomycetia bacterium]